MHMNFNIFLNSFIIYSPIHNSTNFQLMTNLSATCDGKNPSPSSDEFAQCVENISVLNLRLKNADERCQLLKADLRQAKQVCELDLIDHNHNNHEQSPRSPPTTSLFLVSHKKNHAWKSRHHIITHVKLCTILHENLRWCHFILWKRVKTIKLYKYIIIGRIYNTIKGHYIICVIYFFLHMITLCIIHWIIIFE